MNKAKFPLPTLFPPSLDGTGRREKEGEKGIIKTPFKDTCRYLLASPWRRTGMIMNLPINTTAYRQHTLPCIPEVLYYYIPWGVKGFFVF
jgi:hypothetical protein